MVVAASTATMDGTATADGMAAVGFTEMKVSMAVASTAVADFTVVVDSTVAAAPTVEAVIDNRRRFPPSPKRLATLVASRFFARRNG
jgi:hypothetical protein